jgi:hypothetical protein
VFILILLWDCDGVFCNCCVFIFIFLFCCLFYVVDRSGTNDFMVLGENRFWRLRPICGFCSSGRDFSHEGEVYLTDAHRLVAWGFFSVSKYHNPSTVGWRVY